MNAAHQTQVMQSLEKFEMKETCLLAAVGGFYGFLILQSAILVHSVYTATVTLQSGL
jgi:hypothetical protein